MVFVCSFPRWSVPSRSGAGLKTRTWKKGWLFMKIIPCLIRPLWNTPTPILTSPSSCIGTCILCVPSSIIPNACILRVTSASMFAGNIWSLVLCTLKWLIFVGILMFEMFADKPKMKTFTPPNNNYQHYQQCYEYAWLSPCANCKNYM